MFFFKPPSPQGSTRPCHRDITFWSHHGLGFPKKTTCRYKDPNHRYRFLVLKDPKGFLSQRTLWNPKWPKMVLNFVNFDSEILSAAWSFMSVLREKRKKNCPSLILNCYGLKTNAIPPPHPAKKSNISSLKNKHTNTQKKDIWQII